ncbi:hypothetical protein [Variovorax sp. Root434]|uniref:hypothetical protein n=1 Tax=Variovorax sp. Root434 TaxID=1736536 RepID=UPI0006F2E25D|nr:hypothetical protein [Variovorax sp. Root434]KQX35074.1 hypothetical protein ASD05_24080 [Variovorax sp. Root434]
MPFPVLHFRFVLAAAALLAACSPTFNWREVPVAESGLIVLLPCKADRANRALPLGAESVQVDMTGCDAGGATFAIAHASASGPEQAEAWLRAWHAATRGQLGEAQVAETPASVQRATAAPAPLRLDAQPRQQQGASASAPVQVLWFAQSQKDGTVALYQATVLGKPSSPEASKTFFESLRLP